MKKQQWMDQSEEPLGSWAVFIGENGPTTAKITGRLYVTTRHVYFKSLIQLDRNAGLLMGGGPYHADIKPPFHVMDERIQIARERITRVSESREWLILRSLHLHFDSGQQLVFRFGAASPRRALAALAIAQK